MMGERIVMTLFLLFAIGMCYMAVVMFMYTPPVALDFDRAIHGW